jgi:hypothetical protein
VLFSEEKRASFKGKFGCEDDWKVRRENEGIDRRGK